jgi:hypothetical protein
MSHTTPLVEAVLALRRVSFFEPVKPLSRRPTSRGTLAIKKMPTRTKKEKERNTYENVCVHIYECPKLLHFAREGIHLESTSSLRHRVSIRPRALFISLFNVLFSWVSFFDYCAFPNGMFSP